MDAEIVETDLKKKDFRIPEIAQDNFLSLVLLSKWICIVLFLSGALFQALHASLKKVACTRFDVS